jgi:glycosyltransferase involved in cell wall biosynthesis
VSNPADMLELAKLMPDVEFKSTVGKNVPKNVHIIGTMPVDNMREWVRHAGIYLATARETFGIGTLEALSCGVPVVGWDWGGQAEIVKHGETGFLAEPHDYKALSEGIRWAIANRIVLGNNAREDAIARWTWPVRIKQYAEFYKRAKRWWDLPTVKVSVIVTCHDLARYLNDCLESVLNQKFQDWECVIVDDDSSDETPKISQEWVNRDSRFRYLRTPSNLKLSGARNYGIVNAKGRYIIHLDADDMLDEAALGLLSDALDSNPSIHIAYGHLDTVDDNGKNRQRNSWPTKQYSWTEQVAHLNQLPYSAMIRREVFERTGGYRERHWRAEDAPFWILATSYGFRAEKVTQASMLIYRMRSDSKSKGEPGDGDWTAWFPFRFGADSGKEGARLMRARAGMHPNPDIVPWGCQEGPPTSMKFWRVPDCTKPLISIVIPVGPGHERLLVDALDSVRAMTFQDWECIVVNATGQKWMDGFLSPVAGAPWAKVIDAGKKLKPAGARNLGAKFAKAEAILFLDADDMILPNAIQEMYEIHLGTNGGLVYGDWLRSDGLIDQPAIYYEADDFVCGDVLKHMRHSVTCIIPKWAHEKVGGFDESLPGWEDWDYFIAIQSIGVCSYRLESPIITYRFRAGTIREESFGLKKEILKRIREKWAGYYERRLLMPCGGCPGKRKIAFKRVSYQSMQHDQTGNYEELMMLIYNGPGDKVSLRGRITEQIYHFRKGEPKYVKTEDAKIFLTYTRKGNPDFVISQPVAPVAKQVESIKSEHEVMKPEFPEMPDVPEAVPEVVIEVIQDVSEIKVKDLAAAAVDASNTILLQWAETEKRATAIKIIAKEMQSRGIS